MPASLAPDRNPYADAAAPYKVDRVQASGKFPEPLLNTPKTITVLSKEVLQDKNITSLREVGRSTAGVTLGTGEGGNAFGDRFFIRGFDARNDVFIDGIRDPAVSIRENFFTEQIEILRGPASSYAGRGTAGGAINIVTKQAGDRNFYNAETTFGTDHTKRVTLDVNQVISPTFSIRTGGMFQDANVAGRNYVTDDRWGGFISTKWTPTNDIKITTNYVHTDLSGLPDFGVPWYRQGNTPVTEAGIPRQNWYGFVNRDFQTARQDFGTLTAEYKVTDSHHADQPDPRGALAAGLYRHAAELARRRQIPIRRNGRSPRARRAATSGWTCWRTRKRPRSSSIRDRSSTRPWSASRSPTSASGSTATRGLSSEAFGGGAFTGTGALPGQSIYAPSYTFIPFNTLPSLGGNPTRYNVDSKALYCHRYRELAGHDHPERRRALRRLRPAIVEQHGIRARSTRTSSIITAVSSSSRCRSEASMRPTRPRPIRSAPNSTAPPRTTAELLRVRPSMLGPERNKAAEVGTKWELFDRHLLVTGALFHTEKDNARETVSGVLTSGAAYQVEGIDLEVSGKITDRWSVFGGLVLMRSKVTQSAMASNIGLQMANIAHESFSMLTKYKFDGGWELGGQAVYRSKIYGGTFGANTGTELPSYWRFDAFVEKKVDQELDGEALRTEPDQQALLRHALPQCDAVRRGRAGAGVLPRHVGEVLSVLICVPEVLSKDDVADFRRIMDGCAWEDGRSTAGAQSAMVKSNEQLPPDSEMSRKLGNSDRLRADRQSAVHLGCDPVADLSAAVQSLRCRGRASFRHSCR